ERRADAWRRTTLSPCNNLVRCIQSSLNAIRGDGVIEAVLNVVLTGPHDLDRRAGGLSRQQSRFYREITFRFSTEPATEQRVVHGDVVLVHAQLLRDVAARSSGAL